MNSSRGTKRKQDGKTPKEQKQSNKKKPKKYKINKKVDFIMEHPGFPRELRMEVVSYIPMNMVFETKEESDFYKDHLLFKVGEDELQMVPNKFRHDNEFMKKLIVKFPKAKKLMLEPKDDNDEEGSIVPCTERQFYYYRDLFLDLVEHFCNLQYASHSLRNDFEVVMKAVNRNGRNLQFASKSLKKDREIVMAAVQKTGTALDYASKELKNDREIVMVAVRSSGYALQYASKQLKNDREIVMAAVQDAGYALKFASEELKKDREIVMAAVREVGYALHFALAKELKHDREIVMAAVQKNGGALQYASKELKNDREIVLAALKKDGFALEYASGKLKNDREVVVAAFSNNPYSFQYASKQLKNDIDFKVNTAIRVEIDIDPLQFDQFAVRRSQYGMNWMSWLINQ